MNIHPTILVSLVSVLFSIIGFFCVILLNLILRSQANMTEKITTLLERMAGFAVSQTAQDDKLCAVVEQLKGKMDRSECKALEERCFTGRHIDRG